MRREGQTKLRLLKGSHEREMLKLKQELSEAWNLVHSLRQGQLLTGQDLSGRWHAVGVDSTGQQLSMKVLIEHDVGSGTLHGREPDDDTVSVELRRKGHWSFRDGRVLGCVMHFIQQFANGQQVEWAMKCERGAVNDDGEVALDAGTVRASGQWSGAIRGDFTATRQLDPAAGIPAGDEQPSPVVATGSARVAFSVGTQQIQGQRIDIISGTTQARHVGP